MSKKKCRYYFFLIFAGALFWLLSFPVYAEEPADGGDKSGGFIFNESKYDPSLPGQTELPEEETVYTAGSGKIIWTPQKDETGKVVSGKLTLRDAVIQNNNVLPNENYGSGIWMPVPFELVLEGDNRITASGAGIFLPDSNHSGQRGLTIGGSGSLTINSERQGIYADGGIEIDGADVTITYGFASGIISEYSDIVIQNGARAVVKSSDSAAISSSAICVNNIGGDVIIKNSRVTAINKIGASISSKGDVRLENSEVTATGKAIPVSAGNAGCFTVSGGSLYVKSTDSYDIYPDPNAVKLTDSAVIYCGGAYNYLIQQGDNIQYASCVYDEASDEVISVGNGSVWGNVTWNEYIRFPQGANEQIYIGYGGSTLTIPEGVTAEIPDKGMLRNSYSGTQAGTFINYGTLNIADGGTLYNFDGNGANGGHNVVMKNYGEINVMPGGVVFNATLLENSGTINIEGTFTNVRVNYAGEPYNGVIQNTGSINGFVNERDTGLLKYLAEGTTVLETGKTLTLGEKTVSGQWDTVLEIPSGGSLTVAEGAVVDAKTHVTKETLETYLKVDASLVVDGLLLLPEDVPEDELGRVTQFLSGTGIVKLGDAEKFIIVVDSGDGNTKSCLLADGSQFTLPGDPVREGYLFKGWYRNVDGNEVPAEPVLTVHGSMRIYAKWEQLPPEEKPGEEDKPGEEGKPGEEKPGDGEKPGGDDNSGENPKPGEEDGSGENPKPGEEDGSGESPKPGEEDGSGESPKPEAEGGSEETPQPEGKGGSVGNISSGGNDQPVFRPITPAAAETEDTADTGAWALGLILSFVIMAGAVRFTYIKKSVDVCRKMR